MRRHEKLMFYLRKVKKKITNASIDIQLDNPFNIHAHLVGANRPMFEIIEPSVHVWRPNSPHILIQLNKIYYKSI